MVFSGIPENVPDNNLESMVESVLSDIDVHVEPRDIDLLTEKTVKSF